MSLFAPFFYTVHTYVITMMMMTRQPLVAQWLICFLNREKNSPPQHYIQRPLLSSKFRGLPSGNPVFLVDF